MNQQNEEEERFRSFVATMSVFLHFPSVEKSIREQIDALANTIIAPGIPSDNEDDVTFLTEYLADNTQEKLKVLVRLQGGSLEKLKRIFPVLFKGASLLRMDRDKDLRRKVCTFLLFPEKSPDIPRYVQDLFRLPEDWKSLMQDRKFVTAIASISLGSQYAVAMGKTLEKAIAEVILDAGYKYEQGHVKLVDGKEVDLAIPSIENPEVLIMSSYSLTTASGQSSRANEQTRMYDDVQSYNRRKTTGKKVKLVNVIDGGGWIARRNDLRQILKNSDACFSYKTLPELGSYLTSNATSYRA